MLWRAIGHPGTLKLGALPCQTSSLSSWPVWRQWGWGWTSTLQKLYLLNNWKPLFWAYHTWTKNSGSNSILAIFGVSCYPLPVLDIIIVFLGNISFLRSSALAWFDAAQKPTVFAEPRPSLFTRKPHIKSQPIVCLSLLFYQLMNRNWLRMLMGAALTYAWE